MMKFFNRWLESFCTLISREFPSRAMQYLLMAAMLAAFLIIRLATIGAPLPDRTSWKEIDYIAISRNYVANGFQFHRPEISWPAEPPRVTAMEFPLVPYLAAILYALFGFSVYTLRLIPVIAFLLMSWYVFLLGRREFNPSVGLLAALASLIMPLYHPFGRILFSEPLMIACSVLSIYFYAQWADFGKKRDYLLGLAGFSLAVALKLTPLYLVIPLFWITFRKYRFEIGRYGKFVGLFAGAMILPLLWYSYAYYLTYHSIDVFGIFKGHNKMQTLTMISNPEWYHIMLHRIGGSVLGGIIWSILALTGLFAALAARRGGLVLAYLAAVAVFFIIVAEGQIDAPYRQLEIIPPISVFLALGILAVPAFVAAALPKISESIDRRLKTSGSLTVGMVIAFLLFFFHVHTIFGGNPEAPGDSTRWFFSREIRKYAGPGSKIITAGEYTIHAGGNDLSPVLYYYTGLQGWSLQKGQWDLEYVERLRRRGGTLFAAVMMSREPESLPFIGQMKSRYPILFENKDLELLLLDLTEGR